MNHDVRLRPLLPSNDPQLFARILEDVASDVVLKALYGTDPQAYPRLNDYPPIVPNDGGGGGGGGGATPTFTLNKPYIVKRVASDNGILHYLPWDGFCNGVELNKPIMAKRVASNSGVLHYLISDQKLEDDGTLTINKPYLAKRVASNSGVLHYLVGGVVCDVPANPTICGCEICCTLTAVVQVGNGVLGDPWTDPLNVELTCNGSLQVDCSGDATSLLITKTYSGKDTIGSPEAYSGGGASGTREILSDIWDSGNFIIGSETYRLSYWRAGGTVYQTSPSVVTTAICEAGWFLQRLSNDVDYGDYWEVVAGTNFADWLDTNNFDWLFNVALSGPEACTNDLTVFTGCDKYTGTYTSVVESYGDAESCPVFLWHQSRYRLTTDADACENYYKCANVMIADLCSGRLSCDLETILSGGLTRFLDWDVTGCHANSGSNEWVGTACSEFWMFNSGTALVGSGTTAFDGEDPSGAGTYFADFCDAEDVIWHTSGDYASGGISSRIEAALVCYTPETGDPYIAAYALLTQACSDPLGDTCGGISWSYKTRDLAITIDGDSIIVSFTGLTPFVTDSGYDCTTTDCSCDPPTLSLAWRIKLMECA